MKTYKPRHELNRELNSGERQVATNPTSIDFWHRWRYKEALNRIDEGDTVLDLGCGIGYGSCILAQKARCVAAVDDSLEAIEFARQHFSHDTVSYINKDIFDIRDSFDVVVAFEILEHTEKPEKFFELASRITRKRLVLSTPHVSVDLENSPFHYRHFTAEEIKSYMEKSGFKVTDLRVLKFTKGLAIFCGGSRC